MRSLVSTGKALCLLSLGTILSLIAAGTASAEDKKKSLDNLGTAFNGESNANAKYVAYARKADEEGYGEVASLFRAAARAEEIHAKNHAEVIRKMGGEAKADIKAAVVKTTRENLEDALKGETDEKDTMYPGFIETADAEGDTEALRTFSYALYAETQHARLYKKALDTLDSLKGSKAKDYFVCPTCGNTGPAVPFEKCPVCASPKEKFEKVS